MMKYLLIIAHTLLTLWWRLTRPILFGVRILLIQDGQVVLVKHVYQPEWFLPGGGLKRYESLEQAIRREAREEVGANLGEVQLFDFDTSVNHGITLHLAVFLCSDFTMTGHSDAEIAEKRFFPLEALPENISPSNRIKIDQYRAKR